MTIFNHVTTSSIINPTSVRLETDTELHVVSFLSFNDQVVLSGINKAVHTLLSNTPYFQNLFLKYYHRADQSKDHENCYSKKVERLSKNHPTNFYKVACCILESGKLNLKASFINEALSYEKISINQQIDKDSLRLRMICGDNYVDPRLSSQNSFVHSKISDLTSNVGEISSLGHRKAMSMLSQCSPDFKIQYTKILTEYSEQKISLKDCAANLEKLNEENPGHEELPSIINSMKEMCSLAETMDFLIQYDPSRKEQGVAHPSMEKVNYLVDDLKEIEKIESDNSLFTAEQKRFEDFLSEYKN